MFKLFVNGSEKDVLHISKFPAGESLVRITDTSVICSTNKVSIYWKFEDVKEVFDLMLIVNAIRNIKQYISIELLVPYLPFARQDRVCNEGESFSLKVIGDVLNSLRLNAIDVWDVHSQKAFDTINGLQNKTQKMVFELVATKFNLVNPTIVFPDAGAVVKSHDFNCKKIFAEKCRDPLTGKLSGFKIINHNDILKNEDLYIVDDICDGGGTFVGVANELKKYTNGKIYLYVTHCIASKGFEVFDNIIEKVYTANAMCEPHEKLLTLV